MIDRSRLRTPPQSADVLIEPAASGLPALLRPARDADPEWCGVTVSRWRNRLRDRLDLPPDRPLIVTGHQAEFFHAGVLAKSLAAGELAEQCGGTAVWLVVDFDTPKSLRMRVPQRTAGGLRLVEVEIPALRPGLPMQRQPAAPRSHWLDFFERAATLVPDPSRTILSTVADAFCAADGAITLSDGIDRARERVESLLAQPSRTVRAAHMCESAAFRAFAADLALRAEEVAAAYNDAQRVYRARHGVRNAAIPAPPLATVAGRVELPLWILRPDGRRARPFVQRGGDDLRFFADDDLLGTVAGATLRDPASADSPWPILPPGALLRPRALTFSAFARMAVADLFIHGIGGAKYDEMTEAYCTALYGPALAPAACVTATAWADLPRFGVPATTVDAARRRARDVIQNPQRHTSQASAELLERREALVRENRVLREERPRDRRARRAVYEQLRAVRRELSASEPWLPARSAEELRELEARQEQDRAATDRELFFGLIPMDVLQTITARIRAELDRSAS
ncbi:MAG: hypothetical protein HRU75_02895 [Planctomycetia bacterium]|nr:MAG: hypothetical protein HRU75_02895 [Planctomycetia bacterium]